MNKIWKQFQCVEVHGLDFSPKFQSDPTTRSLVLIFLSSLLKNEKKLRFSDKNNFRVNYSSHNVQNLDKRSFDTPLHDKIQTVALT